MENEHDPYQELATAVIAQATRDWRKSPKERPSIEVFFASEWFITLCDIAIINPVVGREICKLGTKHFEKTKQTMKTNRMMKKAAAQKKAQKQTMKKAAAQKAAAQKAV